jgi:glycosyltransferase involved in cell wall biosynthesis
VKVSVTIITYNQEGYIGQALDSALGQDTDFEYEVVVGEDCSSDRTRHVLLEYQHKHPDRLRLILNDWNMGAAANYDRILKTCRGEYIALLDGDDFWTSPRKLRRQVEFMDAHPGCPMCFHPARMIFEDGNRESCIWGPKVDKKFFSLADILRTVFIPVSSTFVRGELFRRLPEACFASQGGDWGQYVTLAKSGDIGFVNEVMSAYRVHPGGVWSAMSIEERFDTIIKSNQATRKILDEEHRRIIDHNVAYAHHKLFEHHRDSGNARKALYHLALAFQAEPSGLTLTDLWRSFGEALSRDRRLAHLRTGRSAQEFAPMDKDKITYFPPYDWTTEE